MNYTYKFFPGRGYAGLVNGKIFTGYYDERDLEELKNLLQKKEDDYKNKASLSAKKKEEIKNKSFRDYMRDVNPKLAFEYEKWKRGKVENK